MPTPKPGQIRCPTCSRSTPPAAFCTQCGSPIPVSARARPRGLDREELEERVRGRRPDDAAFRRGTEIDPSEVYQPFQPEPEDALAVRESEGGDEPEPPRVDNAPPDLAEPAPSGVEAYPAEGEAAAGFGAADDGGGVEEPPYAYNYPPDDGGRRDSGALPLLGFAALAVMALAVGVILAGLFGPGETAQASPSPTASPTAAPTQTAAPTATPAPTEPVVSSTPEPTEGPITFPDGAMLTVQPCGSYEFLDLTGRSFSEWGCQVDGSTRDTGTVWILVALKGVSGNDQVSVELQLNGDTIDRSDKVPGEVLGCDRCNGVMWGAIYRGLAPGNYHLVLRRNGGYADSADFVVQ